METLEKTSVDESDHSSKSKIIPSARNNNGKSINSKPLHSQDDKKVNSKGSERSSMSNDNNTKKSEFWDMGGKSLPQTHTERSQREIFEMERQKILLERKNAKLNSTEKSGSYHVEGDNVMQALLGSDVDQKASATKAISLFELESTAHALDVSVRSSPSLSSLPSVPSVSFHHSASSNELFGNGQSPRSNLLFQSMKRGKVKDSNRQGESSILNTFALASSGDDASWLNEVFGKGTDADMTIGIDSSVDVSDPEFSLFKQFLIPPTSVPEVDTHSSVSSESTDPLVHPFSRRLGAGAGKSKSVAGVANSKWGFTSQDVASPNLLPITAKITESTPNASNVHLAKSPVTSGSRLTSVLGLHEAPNVETPPNNPPAIIKLDDASMVNDIKISYDEMPKRSVTKSGGMKLDVKSLFSAAQKMGGEVSESSVSSLMAIPTVSSLSGASMPSVTPKNTDVLSSLGYGYGGSNSPPGPGRGPAPTPEDNSVSPNIPPQQQHILNTTPIKYSDIPASTASPSFVFHSIGGSNNVSTTSSSSSNSNKNKNGTNLSVSSRLQLQKFGVSASSPLVTSKTARPISLSATSSDSANASSILSPHVVSNHVEGTHSVANSSNSNTPGMQRININSLFAKANASIASAHTVAKST